MVAAERVWLDRWRFNSKSDWPTTPDSIDELEAMFAELASERTTWFENDPEFLSNAIQYRDLKGGQHVQTLGGLVMHVLNHSVLVDDLLPTLRFADLRGLKWILG